MEKKQYFIIVLILAFTLSIINAVLSQLFNIPSNVLTPFVFALITYFFILSIKDN